MKATVTNHEPHLALFVPDEHPFLFYHAIAKFAIKHLKPGGYIYFEINENLSFELEYSLKELGIKNISSYKDIHNKERIMKCKCS
jgi:release factor glutamine methyltransferase